MKKNRKIFYGKGFITFFVFFFIFSFITNIAGATVSHFGYINSDNKTMACGYTDQSTCDAYLKKTYPSQTNIACVTDIPCTDKTVYYIDPQTDTTKSDVYTFLAPLTSEKTAPNDIGIYFNWIFTLAIGLCGALAVIMIVIGGVQYMGEESIFGKTEAKKQITHAILGLLIALGAFALLNTINPDLLNTSINIKSVSAEIGGDTDAQTVFNRSTLPAGIVCSGGQSNISNIAKSFNGKMTYEMGAKGTVGLNNTIKLDCSGFVNYVLDCAGLPDFVSGGTASIFANAEKITSISGTTINNIELKIGDVIGWKAGENGEKFGHIMIYIGGGQFADSHSSASTGSALGTFSISQYQNRIKYIKRAP